MSLQSYLLKEIQESLQARKSDPLNAAAYFHPGEVYEKLEQKKEALANYEEASELDPSYTNKYELAKLKKKN